MKKSIKIAFTVITGLLLACMLLQSCKQKSSARYKYEVQIGTAFFCLDYETDTLKTTGNTLVFTDSHGKVITVEKSKVLTIKQPGDEKPNY